MNKHFVLINGILTSPGDVNAWTDRAEAWIEDLTKNTATRHEYFSGALTRRIFQSARVEQLRSIVNRSNNDIVLVGHSNGADLIERFIRSTSRRIAELHLIAAASEHDFRKNGYNQALISNRVGKICVYFSKKDEVLRKCSKVTPWLKWVGLGYGYLGYTGPKYVNTLCRDRVIESEWECGHSDYFKNENFDKIMRQIVSTQ